MRLMLPPSDASPAEDNQWDGLGGSFSSFSTSLCSLEVSEVGVEVDGEAEVEAEAEAEAVDEAAALGNEENGKLSCCSC